MADWARRIMLVPIHCAVALMLAAPVVAQGGEAGVAGGVGGDPAVNVFVDDDFGPDHRGWGRTHFDRIADAVAAVAPGGVVQVGPGNYLERVVVAKTIAIRAEPPGAARVLSTLDGAFELRADGVELSGLQVIGDRFFPPASVLVKSSHNRILDNFFLEGQVNVHVQPDPGHTAVGNRIVGNLLSERFATGIRLGEGVEDTWIEDNRFNLASFLIAGAERTTLVSNEFYVASLSDCTGVKSFDNRWTAELGLARASQASFVGDRITASTLFSDCSGLSIEGGAHGTLELLECPGFEIFDAVLDGFDGRAGLVLDGCDGGSLRGCELTGELVALEARNSDGLWLQDCLLDAPVGMSVGESTGLELSASSFPRGGLGLAGDLPEHWDSHQLSGNLVGGRPLVYSVGPGAAPAFGPRPGQLILVNHQGFELADLFFGVEAGPTPRGGPTAPAGLPLQLAFSSDFLLRDSLVVGAHQALVLEQCFDLTVERCGFVDGQQALVARGSSDVRIERNYLAHNELGSSLDLDAAEVSGNTFADVGITPRISCASTGSTFHTNDFVQVPMPLDDCPFNSWNTAAGGNHWADLPNVDSNGDGFGDAPVLLRGRGGRRDMLPLVTPSTGCLSWADAHALAPGQPALLHLDAGNPRAGAPYRVIVGATGTHPGFSLGALTVPLNPDAFVLASLRDGSPFVDPASGLLDGDGRAELELGFPLAPLLPPGTRFDHVALVLTPTGLVASAPVPLVVGP